MDINAGIIDQRLTGIMQEHAEIIQRIAKNDLVKQRSLSFVLLCVSVFLDISLASAGDLLTEGGNDAGVDALHFGEVEEGEFTITLFQGKYKKDLSGEANFPENGVKDAIQTVMTLFDPHKQIQMNPYLKPKIEEIRSLIQDGYIPNIRIILCNNGKKWNQQAETWIQQELGGSEQVEWVHLNHATIVSALQHTKSINDSIQLHGKAIIEDFNFRRVLIGKVLVSEIAHLFDKHHDQLLERNIRKYLGLRTNRVNSAIHDTLSDTEKRKDFYFLNNGITMICRKFSHNALQGEHYRLRIEDAQVINGGQTCKTIQQSLKSTLLDDFSNTFVLLRVYELEDKDQAFVQDITYATNSQNPVDLRDLRSNDPLQKQLEIGIQDLGYTYKRQREDSFSDSHMILSSVTAEAVLAIFRKKPHQAKFLRREHFGKLYDEIFRELNAAQAVLAVLIFRFVENARKRTENSNATADYPFLPYASHYLAMLLGKIMLRQHNFSIQQLNHQNFRQLLTDFNENGHHYLTQAILECNKALIGLYGSRPISLQQLSATFRRGDLLNILENS